MHNIYADGKKTLDLVPCDIVVNLILSQAWYTAMKPEPSLTVAHASSSYRNPIGIDSIVDIILQYSKYHPYHRQFSNPWAQLTAKKYIWKYYIATREKIPTKMIENFATLSGNNTLLK